MLHAVRRPIAAIVIALLALDSTAAATCFTEREVEALAAISRNTYYAGVSYGCQTQYPALRTYELHEGVMNAWPTQWNSYFATVESLYKRIFKAGWSAEYEKFKKDTANYVIQRTAREGLVNEQNCRVITLENSLGQKDWPRVRASVVQSMQRHMICKP